MARRNLITIGLFGLLSVAETQALADLIETKDPTPPVGQSDSPFSPSAPLLTLVQAAPSLVSPASSATSPAVETHGETAGEGAVNAAAARSDFETFELPRPKHTGPSAPVSAPQSSMIPASAFPTANRGRPGRRMDLSTTLSLNRWDQTLSLGMDGASGSRTWASSWVLDPRRTNSFFNEGFLSLQQEDSTFRFGQSSSDLYGGVSGLLYTKSLKNGSGFNGGIYSLSSGAESKFIVGVGGTTPLGRLASLGGLYGADGSWRVYANHAGRNLSAYAHVGSLSQLDGLDWSSFLNLSLGRGTTLSQRLTGRGGKNPFSGNSSTLFTKLGTTLISLDRSQSSDETQNLGLQSLLAIFPRKRNQFSLQYQRIHVSSEDAPSERNQFLSLGMYHNSRGGRSLWGQADLELPGTPGWSLGYSAPLSRQVRAAVEFGQPPGAGLRIRNLRLTLATGDDTSIGLIYGPGTGYRSAGRIGWGLELTRRFRWAANRTGSLEGTVEPLGGDLPAGLGLLLDERIPVAVDKAGHYRVSKLEAGFHRLQMDPRKLPAEWRASDSSLDVQVAAGKSTKTAFQIQRLGGVAGAVRTLRPLTEAQQDLKLLQGLVVSLNTGQKTLTNEDGAFLFANLPPGDYVASLDPEFLPEGYTPVGPTSWNLHVDAGSLVAETRFTIDQPEKPIIFTDIPEKK